MSKITCPFCFEAFDINEVHFRCVSLRCPGQKNYEPDPIYEKEHGQRPRTAGHVIVLNKSSKVKRGSLGLGPIESVLCDIPECGKEARTRLCPNCHFELSHDIGKVTQKIVAVVGGSAAGKSHYIVSLITRLEHVVGPKFRFAVIRLGDDTQERWERDFYGPLFRKKRRLTPTQRAIAGNAAVKRPLMFRLTFDDGKKTRALNISFFDTAGEDVTDTNLEQLNSAEARYIARADGLIVLLDPLQIDSIREELTPQALAVRQTVLNYKAHPQRILERFWELLEKSDEKLTGARKVPIPIALTLSKIDVLRDLVELDSSFLRDSNHNGVFNLTDMQSVHAEIEARLEDWLPGFKGKADAKFANYRFFGVSALGNQPDSAGNVNLSPLRVEDPFLWILSEFGLVTAKKG